MTATLATVNSALLVLDGLDLRCDLVAIAMAIYLPPTPSFVLSSVQSMMQAQLTLA